MNRKYSIAPVLTILGLLVLTATQPAGAAVFVKFDGVDGEALDKDHSAWIEVESLSARMDLNPMSVAAGATQPRADITHDDFILTKTADKASAKLAEAVCNGKVFPKVVIDVPASYGSARATYLRYELRNVRVTSYSVSGAGGSAEKAMEEIALNFEEVKVTYTENEGKSKGNVETELKVDKGE